MAKQHVLLMGYNGANNTGAEALLLADIQDVRAVMGTDAIITIPTLNEANLRRYVREGPALRIAPIPSIYFLALRRLVRNNDLIVLVEGSTYMDTWTSALLWAFLWTTHCAHRMGKPSLAYAVDAGRLSTFDRYLVRREASKTDLIITRSKAAADRLRSWGVAAPIEVTADNAFTFRPDRADDDFVNALWPEARAGIVGFCSVNIFRWPVVMRPWGRGQDLYKWPYYFSRSRDRLHSAETLAQGYAALADRVVEEHEKCVALICMEQLDEPFARRIRQLMRRPDRARIVSSREYNASQLTVLLRRLDLLVTSRYHASILSLAARVPQVAVGHDLRLKSLYGDLGLSGFFIDAFAEDMHAVLRQRVEELLTSPGIQHEALRQGYSSHLARARCNRALLRTFVERHRRSEAA